MSASHAAKMADAGQGRTPIRGGALKERLGDFLRAQHPRDGGKHVQTRLAGVGMDVGYETCRSWWRGLNFPTAPNHIQALAAAYGAPFLGAVFGPEMHDHLAAAEAEATRIQLEADAARARAEAIRQHRRTTLGL